MATKKELEARIAALEVEIALLKARQPITVLPKPADVPWPHPNDFNPYWPPKVWCGVGTGMMTSSVGRQFTVINGAA